jgi:hypothetical protein
MFCVIQKVVNKKPNAYGAAKEIIAKPVSFTIGDNPVKYTYSYSEEKFERPIKDAYKISIHKSYREDGKVKKKQWSICTMSYYDLIEFSLFDCAGSRIEKKAKEIGITEEKLYDMIEEKLEYIRNIAVWEFQQTKEYKAKREHDNILKAYRMDKELFEGEYGSGEYDYCYDIFGDLRNEKYLNQLKERKKARQEYQKRSYQDHKQSNYNYDFSSLLGKSSTYSADEKAKLKKIYRVASKKFHPDVANDDGEMMKFLTKLKEEWGI